MSRYNNGVSGTSNGTKENGNSKDGLFDLDSPAFASDQFRMHEFKVKRCPRARPHDWTQCPFAHPGEKARRRDPRRYKYSGTACPEFRKSGCCRRGDACPFAHGVFECWLHPSRYRTQLCTDGTSCRRRVCFFAHVEAELRHPEDDPGVAQQQVQAELAAEVQTLQHQHLTQALQALLLQTTNPPLVSPDAQIQQTHGLLTKEALKRNSTTLPSTTTNTGNTNGGNGNASGVLTSANDGRNSTTALHLALLQLQQQQQQQQQTPNVEEKTTSSGQVSIPTDGGIIITSEGLQSSSATAAQIPDVLEALNQLQQLTSMTTGTANTSAPIAHSNGHLNPVGGNGVTNALPAVDAAAILSQMMSGGGNGHTNGGNGSGNGTDTNPVMGNGATSAAGNGGSTSSSSNLGDLSNNSLLITSLLGQNPAKMAVLNGNNGQSSRRSIDNSYLTSGTPEVNNVIGQLSSSGYPAIFPNGAYMQPPLPPPNVNHAMTQDLASPATTTNGMSGLHMAVPVSDASTPNTMYSIESIQLLLQNPAFSATLSQLFQMNPALLQQLTVASTTATAATTTNANDSGNQPRRSIDNAYLTQLSTDMNRYVNNGGMRSNGHEAQHSGSNNGNCGSNGIASHPSQDSLLISDLYGQNGGPQRLANGMTVSEALIQGLNALKMQIEGTTIPLSSPCSVPFSVQTSLPGDNVYQLQSMPLNNNNNAHSSSSSTSSDNALQIVSESVGDATYGTDMHHIVVSAPSSFEAQKEHSIE